MSWTLFWQVFVLTPWVAVWVGGAIPRVRTTINKMS